MADNKKNDTAGNKPQPVGKEDFANLEKAGRRGLFGRINRSLNEAIQTGRGTERQREALPEKAEAATSSSSASVDDIALRRARNVSSTKMIVPDGVVISGSVSGSSDMEINGKVEGDITVQGRLLLGPTALVSGNVQAGFCQIMGRVEGRVECSEELDLGQSGRLNADVVAGKRINLAGAVYGDVTTHGVLRMMPTARVDGDVRARNILMEEGATMNGQCIMRSGNEKPAEASAQERSQQKK